MDIGEKRQKWRVASAKYRAKQKSIEATPGCIIVGQGGKIISPKGAKSLNDAIRMSETGTGIMVEVLAGCNIHGHQISWRRKLLDWLGI